MVFCFILIINKYSLYLNKKYIMNYKLSKELYSSPWAIDQLSASALLQTLNNLRSGMEFEKPDIKLNSFYANCESNTFSEPINDVSDLAKIKNFNGVAVMSFDGPITLNGGMSSKGVIEQSKLMIDLAQDNRVKSFLLVANSGGGATAAVEMISRTILRVRNEFKKDVKSWTPEGGMAASAMYGIISACSSIHSEHEMSQFGSCGTMINISGRASGEKDSNGSANFRIYASKSIKKNNEVEELFNNNNTEIIVNELLDPINERFLSLIESNRPQLKGSNFDDGRIVFAKDGVGTFIDSIASYNEVLGLLLKNEKKVVISKNNNINSKNKNMDASQLKSEFPEVYNQIFEAGKNEVRSEVNTWLAWESVDSNAVIEGIKSGKGITPEKREEMFVKSMSKNKLEEIVSASPKDVVTQQVQEVVETEVVENDLETESKDLLKFFTGN